MSPSLSGADVVLDVLRSEGVRYVFGNPGSSEIPFIASLGSDGAPHYVLGLHESCAVSMADGYAQASGFPAVVNVHAVAGTGNSIGYLANCRSRGSPIVVIAGQQYEDLLPADPLTSWDLVAMARPVTKWAHEIRSADELGVMLRRAFHDVLAPPRGPVYLSVPASMFEDLTSKSVPPASHIYRRPVADGLNDLAALLTEPVVGDLAIVSGFEVVQSGAEHAVAELAELLGAPVFASPFCLEAFPSSHPLWSGMLPGGAAGMRSMLLPFRRVFVIGDQPFQESMASEGSPLPDGAELLHLSVDPMQLGRRYPVVLGTSGDPRASLEQLVPLVRARADGPAALHALRAARDRQAEAQQRLDREARSRYDQHPMDRMAAGHALMSAMADDSIVVDEAMTAGPDLNLFHRWTRPGQLFTAKSIVGWGMPFAAGVSLAHDRSAPVLCAVGDGSAMFSPQALWTAARENLPVVFAVYVNREYQVIKDKLRQQKGSHHTTGNFIAVDLDEPPIDYAALARSMHVSATTVSTADAIEVAVRTAIEAGRPHLLELIVDPSEPHPHLK